MRAAACIVALTLAGCDSAPQSLTRDQIIDIADDSVPDTAPLEARLMALEAEVKRLREDGDKTFEHLSGLSSIFVESGGSWDRSFENLEHNQAVLFEHVNCLRARDGLPPIPTGSK